MTWVNPSCSRSSAPLADCESCWFFQWPTVSVCMCVRVGAEPYPSVCGSCQVHIPCTLGHLFQSEKSSLLHFCFGRNVVCVHARARACHVNCCSNVGLLFPLSWHAGFLSVCFATYLRLLDCGALANGDWRLGIRAFSNPLSMFTNASSHYANQPPITKSPTPLPSSPHPHTQQCGHTQQRHPCSSALATSVGN